jgi:hypothetical protein
MAMKTSCHMEDIGAQGYLCVELGKAGYGKQSGWMPAI